MCEPWQKEACTKKLKASVAVANASQKKRVQLSIQMDKDGRFFFFCVADARSSFPLCPA